MFLIVTWSFQISFAALKPVHPSQIRQLANDYQVQKQIQAFRRSRSSVSFNGIPFTGTTPNNCPPPGTNGPTGANFNSCIDSVCTHLSKFDCDDASEIQNVAKICKGNINGDCLDSYCSKLGKFSCDDISEVSQVAGLCKGVSTGNCSTIICDKLGKFGCDDFSEISQVAAICTPNLDSGCVANVCAKLGKFDCDDISEIQQVAASCTIF
jgi:hypothetical protein